MIPISHLCYLSGFFCGEGCINLSKQGQIRIIVAQNNPHPLTLFKKYFHGNIYKKHPGKNSRKISYEWRISNSNHIKKFLSDISPYLIVKYEEALVALDFIEKKKHIERGNKIQRNELIDRYRKILRDLKDREFQDINESLF